MVIRQTVCALFIGLILSVNLAQSAQKEFTKTEATALANRILRNNAVKCRLKTRSISAVKVKNGWRVTAKIIMSAGGITRPETARWIVSRRNGAVAQDQLTAEIENGCR